MQIRGRKRKRSQQQAYYCHQKTNKMTQAGSLIFGVGFCLLVLSYLADDEHFMLLADYPNMKFSMSMFYDDDPIHWRNKLKFDFPLGPAVERAKYFGFANRDSNQGHNRSDWDLLSTQICDDANGEETRMLSDMEIYQRKLPTAILLGVQKGGTTALSKYLFKHGEIERTEKELYVLDEALDNHLFQQARQQDGSSTIPRKRGRDLYSQSTLGITLKLARRQKREQQNGLVGTPRSSDNATETMAAEEIRKRDLQTIQQHRGRRKGQRQIYKNSGGPPRRRRLSEEDAADHQYDSSNGVLLAVETVPPSSQTTFSWDPDAKMMRYFERRKTTYEAADQSTSSKTRKMTLDMTPNYMFHSDRVPARIECLVPWVKLFCILRDPIDRAISQYDMKMRVVKNSKINKSNRMMNSTASSSSSSLINSWGNPVPSLDEFVLYDLEALYEVGVLQDWTKVDFETFWKSKECLQAWNKYIHLGLNAPIGMGLYALQLKPFLDMMERVHHHNDDDSSSPNDKNKNNNYTVQKYFMALDNQDLRNDPDVTYNRLLKFLELSPLTLTQYKMTINQSRGHAGGTKYEVSLSTKDRIRSAIKPYNIKLGELLGEEWGTKWL